MLFRPILLIIPFIITSCGYGKWWDSGLTQRKLASSTQLKSLLADDLSFEQDLMDKLTSLHFYTMIGHKNLKEFDDILDYDSISYRNLLAIHIQMNEIEERLNQAIKNSDDKKIVAFKTILIRFAGMSTLHTLTLENILETLGWKDLIPERDELMTQKEVNDHYKNLQLINEFQIHEKNIDHLSHMIDLKFDSEEKKFVPSLNKMGNINGSEFPQKVWSLTFDDGPSPASPLILQQLKNENLKATFFPLTNQLLSRKSETQELLLSGMEVGAQTWSNRDLTKVGNLALDREITESIKKVAGLQKRQIDLYRLPYGAGMNATHIRERIAQNDVIHVFWSVDTLDWMPQAAQGIAERTIKLMKKTPKDSGIILFHDTHSRTVLSLPDVLNYLKKDGRKVCPVGQIIQLMNQGAPIICH